eukprot:m.75937 g.75937  ORF g.75937 m.75937 type:complete len:221 (-) comp14616_c0_seq2:984-1646(-)
MSWEALRRESRRLEDETESKLIAFSRLGSTQSADPSGDGMSSDQAFESMASELQSLLLKLQNINDEMVAASGNDTTASRLHILNRHREILTDYQEEFAKTKKSIRHSRERANLLSSVRRDINTHRNSTREELYLKENDHLKNSSRLTDDAISIALSAKDALMSQKATLSNVSTRLGNIFNRFPVVNNLMQKINTRKRRDSIILSLVISVCLFLIFLYMRR